jgi:Arm DNA-binding domain
MRLTAKSVAALTMPPGKSDVIYFDDELPGFDFRLRAGAGGKLLKSWICQFKRAGRTRRMLLGSAAVLGVEAARAAARKVLAKVALGEDPAAERQDRAAKDRNTLRGLVDQYLAAKQPHLRPANYGEKRRYLSGG